MQVLKAIVTETTDITELDKMNRKFLASFLGLAVQIREKLATAEAFENAVIGLAMGDDIFAETLKRIIKMTTNDSEISEDDEIFLAIIKSTTKLVTWMMMDMDTTSSGLLLLLLLLEEIVEKLEAAVKAMIHLERYVVMMTTGGAYDDKEGYVTLQTLVETARNKLVSLRRQQQH
jgi:hypothetical protein